MQSSAVLEQLGARISERRMARGYTQRELAERAGICVEYVSLIERGGRNPSWTTLAAVAAALDVPVRELLT